MYIYICIHIHMYTYYIYIYRFTNCDLIRNLEIIWVNYNDLTALPNPGNHGFILGIHPLLWPQDSG